MNITSDTTSAGALAPFTLAHSSDWHLCYEAYTATTTGGMNQRGADLVAAANNVVNDILAYDPPLVVLPGDLTDTPTVPIKYMNAVRKLLMKAASIRPDGTRRQVVVSSGNHDQPRSINELNFLELFKGLPGIHVVCTRYEQVTFPDSGLSEGRDPVLADTIVHVLPHDQLKRVEWAQVRPVEERVNILMSHGVCGGSELYVRSLGREFAVPTDVLNLPWDYIAMGHWHKRTPVNDRGWYSGSPENVSFRDLRDNGDKRGYLQVTVNPGYLPEVETVDLPIRRMIRLPELDASELHPTDIAAQLAETAKDADLSGAVVWQIVTGVTADTWALVDKSLARSAASSALHYQLTARFAGSAAERRVDRESFAEDQLADVGVLIEGRGKELLGENAEPAVKLAKDLVAQELTASGDEAGADRVDTGPSPAAASATNGDGSTVPPQDGRETLVLQHPEQGQTELYATDDEDAA